MTIQRIGYLASAVAGAFLLSACGGGTGNESGAGAKAAPTQSQPAVVTSDRPGERPPAAASPVASPARGASPSPSPNAQTLEFAGVTYNNHGLQDVTDQDTVEVQADNYYFEPTFLRGPRVDTVKLRIRNRSNTLHNITMLGSGENEGQIQQDIPPNGTVEVEAAFPQTGSFHFFCKYHIGQGMSGQLLSPEATPQVPKPIATEPTRARQG